MAASSREELHHSMNEGRQRKSECDEPEEQGAYYGGLLLLHEDPLSQYEFSEGSIILEAPRGRGDQPLAARPFVRSWPILGTCRLLAISRKAFRLGYSASAKVPMSNFGMTIVVYVFVDTMISPSDTSSCPKARSVSN